METYTSFTELKAAIDAGKVEAAKVEAYIDNDQVDFITENPQNPEDPIMLLSIHPYTLQEQLLDAVGISHQGV